MTDPMPSLVRRTFQGLVIGFSVLLLVGSWWRGQPGRAGAYAVLAISARICRDAGVPNQVQTVADAAHALDRAVLHRSAVALGVAPSCSVGPPASATAPQLLSGGISGRRRMGGQEGQGDPHGGNEKEDRS